MNDNVKLQIKQLENKIKRLQAHIEFLKQIINLTD